MTLPVIGFVGLGNMGLPMADRLCAAGYPLVVSDVAPGVAATFADGHPGTVAATGPADVADSDIVILMLPSSAVVEAVLGGTEAAAGLAEALRPGALVVDMGSSEPARTRALAARLAALDVRLVDAPVSGGVRGATAGTLAVMTGGAPEDLAEVAPLFAHLAGTVVHVGPVGAGHAAKALNNLVSAASVSVTVEALRVAEGFGIAPETMTEVLNGSSGRSNTSENKVVQFMTSGTFRSGFALQLMAKDVRIALDLARSLGCRTDVSDRVEQQWSAVAADVPPATDHTEMYRLVGGAR
ncbi:NAD(P)-dependent oxidoreductase [Nocardioides carbamazepini]|uniref:NAD(P)-dependent oxidoreductase n=1 Tax=Nocardioides carbamazepini TaxID=2854259 RepID=UPI00214A29C9|nr:NAD(P)-dependent oxidoreductase [Nocardioides carbamazepini]MCR1783999.1 NAD(P)-dependent oxidoreductase [Nocardioides carbamazepini]